MLCRYLDQYCHSYCQLVIYNSENIALCKYYANILIIWLNFSCRENKFNINLLSLAVRQQ